MSIIFAGQLVVNALLPSVPRLDPMQFWGIPLALGGAVLLAFGAQYQSRGVNKAERITGKSGQSGLSIHHLRNMLRRPSWVVGSLLLVCAVLLQVTALSLSPLTLVQPIGVVGLVITAVLNSRLSGVKLGKRVRGAIALAVISIAIFVSVAALNVSDRTITGTDLQIILLCFAAIFLLSITLFLLFRRRGFAMIYILGAGTLYGFVATFAKTFLSRWQQGEVDGLALLLLVALAAGTLLGAFFVQNAYSSGPPELVVAGLTVIDPIVAVLIGTIVLREAASAPLWALLVFAITGTIAVLAVQAIARFHPQTGKSALENTGKLNAIAPQR